MGATHQALLMRAATPGSSDPSFSSVQLLLHGDGVDGAAGFVDSSSFGRAVTAVGAAQHDDAQKVFGPTSIYIPNTAAKLEVPNGTHFYFPAGTDFTVEARARLSTVASFQNIIIQGEDNGAWWLRVTNTGKLAFGAIGGSDVADSGSTLLVADTWAAVAMAREGTRLRLFIGGAKVNDIEYDFNVGNASPTTPLTIGGGSFALNSAHVDEVRITKGVARYTANYTPDAAAFPDS